MEFKKINKLSVAVNPKPRRPSLPFVNLSKKIVIDFPDRKSKNLPEQFYKQRFLKA